MSSRQLSVWDVYQKKGITAVIVFFIATQYILEWLRPTIGLTSYFLGLGTPLVVCIVLLFWQVRKIFPASGIGVTTKNVISVPYPVGLLWTITPAVM